MKKLIIVLVIFGAFVAGSIFTPQYAAADHAADFAILQAAFGTLLNAVINGFNAIATAFAALPLPDSIDSFHIIDNSITGDDLAQPSILAFHILSNAIDQSKIATDAVRADKMQENSVGSSELKSSSVGSFQLMGETITSQDIADGTITSADLDDQGITAADFQDGAITGDKIVDESVHSFNILDGTIQFADIANNGCLQDQIIQWDGTGWVCNDFPN